LLITTTFPDEPLFTYSALLRACDAPDHIANIVRNQQRTIGTDYDADRSTIGHLLIRCEEAA
jgi:hypothetical protein